MSVFLRSGLHKWRGMPSELLFPQTVLSAKSQQCSSPTANSQLIRTSSQSECAVVTELTPYTTDQNGLCCSPPSIYICMSPTDNLQDTGTKH